jgi:hypothetical protein
MLKPVRFKVDHGFLRIDFSDKSFTNRRRTTMTGKKEEFLAQLKKKYDDLNYRWNIERNKLEAKAQHESADAIKIFEEKREALGKLRTEMKTKIIELEVASENAWDDVKDGAEEAWTSLANAFDKATSHFKK